MKLTNIITPITIKSVHTGTDSRIVWDIIGTNETYRVVITRGTSIADHILGWVTHVIQNSDDFYKGGYVEIFNKNNRLSLQEIHSFIPYIAQAVSLTCMTYGLQCVYMFGSTVRRRQILTSMAKAISISTGWLLYIDRGYYLIYSPSVMVHQPTHLA